MGSRLEKTSNAIRKRIEQHTFDDEDGEEYDPSKFGGFPEYFRRKKIKLQNRDAARRGNSNKPAIFKGIVCHVNGYTQPSLNDLHDLVIDYGGGFIQYLDGKTMVTHIIASNLTLKKKIEFKKYRIVKPAWIVDSIAAGKLLPWENYRVVDEGSKQNLLGFSGGKMVSQSNNARSGYKEQTDTSWYTGQMKNAANRIDAEPSSSNAGGLLRQRPEIDDAAENEKTVAENPDRKVNDIPHAMPTDKISQPSFDYGSFDGELAKSVEEAITTAPITRQVPLQDVSIHPEGYTRSREITPTQKMTSDSESEEDEEPQEQGIEAKPELKLALEIEAKPNVASIPTVELDADSKHETNSEPQSPQPKSDMEEVVRYDVPGFPPGMVLKNDLQKTTGRKLTAEEHNAILLADPKIWKSSTVNPGFLKQYYEESRLHHLSTWKAELKSKLQAHARETTASQQAKRKRPPGSRRYIFHVDFDSFFVAVSLLNQPDLKDKPCVVAHGDGTGSEIASCNYPARKFGVKNGMWMKSALELCPTLKILPYDFKAYEAASRDFYAAIIETGGIVQSVSIDEALIDLSKECVAISGGDGTGRAECSIYREEAKAQEIAQELRSKIKWKTGCDVSVGIGGNILLAKIALRKAKPAGQHLIVPDAVLDTIGGLNVQDLPGVAYSMGAKLEEIGIKFVKDIREATKEKLTSTLGPKTGEKLWEYARGIDRVEVGDQVIRKSVSAEVNWGVRFVTQVQVDEFVKCLCEELEKRLRNEDVKGRQLTMKIMRKAADSPLDPPKFLGHGKCDVFNKSIVLGIPTTDSKVITREALSILKGHGFSPGELRGIGIQMTKLEPIKPVMPNPGTGQRALQFKTAPKTEEPKAGDSDTIETPQKPIKFVKHPAASLTGEEDKDMATVLNTLGTQFILPADIDPAVLAELPQDIRSKFVRNDANSRADKTQPKLHFKSRTVSPEPRARGVEAVPSASQLDPEVLAALPEDIRAEILAQHHASPRKTVKQTILPQSPHKDRTTKLTNKTTPSKLKPTSLARVRGKTKGGNSTLVQANFARATNVHKDSDTDIQSHDEELAPDVLAALPRQLREEILEEKRRERLKRKGGLELGTTNSKRPRTAEMNEDDDDQEEERFIDLPLLPPKPEFCLGMTTLPEIRSVITQWYDTVDAGEPDDDDVKTLCVYLKKVILEEKDMAKAEAIVKWLIWTIDNDEEAMAGDWDKAMSTIIGTVQDSVKERGLGPISFTGSI